MNESKDVIELSSPLSAPSSSANMADSTASPEDLLIAADEELLSQLESIPDKMAFKIGEVAELVGVKQYVLRYWETEFDVLRPKKSSHNQRMYRRKDVETVFLIKKLLYTDRFSISGARGVIKKLKNKVQQGSVSRESFKRHSGALEKARQLVADIGRLQQKL